ncbi:MAG: ABC transporter ATP-binding protein, partial [Chitinophagaceae bacterium]
MSCSYDRTFAIVSPLLQSASNSGGAGGQASLGELRFFADFIKWLEFDLTITFVLCLLIAVFTLKGLIRFIQLSYYARVRQMFIRKIRYSLVNNLESLSFDAFSKMDSGRIQHTLTVEVQRLFQTMKFYFEAAQAAVMLATYMALAFLANFQFAFLVCIGAALSDLLYRKIYKATKRASVEFSKKGSDFNGYLLQTTLYFKYLKSTNTLAHYARRLKRVVNDAELLNRKLGNMNAITLSVKEPIIILIVSTVVLLQLRFMGAAMSSIILSLLLFYRALNYLVAMQNHWQSFVENIGGMDSVASMLNEMDGLKESKGSSPFHGIKNGICFQNVSFAYDERKVLNNINIDIPARSTIALVGESGSGKTTFANMIAGLVYPSSGKLMIDTTSIKDLNLDNYRDHVGYISQESVIFNDTIFNNITFWAEPSSENRKRFDEVVELAALTEFVQTQPKQADSILGDNGILISGGQKQRISIARELFKKTEILIFDEATSALDSQTETII